MVAEEAGLQIGAELDSAGSMGSSLPTSDANATAAQPNDLEARLAALRK